MKTDSKNNTICKLLTSFLVVFLSGCACPRMSSHYEKAKDGSRDPWHQCTLEAMQCAWKPVDPNPPHTVAVWLAARGIYHVSVPKRLRKDGY
jgi:hypothetical protein